MTDTTREPLLLDPAEKARIHSEERYRHEVRQALDDNAKDDPLQSLKNFLNSSFGVWLLSAIFISGAGTMYQQWQKGRDEQQALLQKARDEQKAIFDKKVATESENREAISRLDVEISYRLSKVLPNLAAISSRIEVHAAQRPRRRQAAASCQPDFWRAAEPRIKGGSKHRCLFLHPDHAVVPEG